MESMLPNPQTPTPAERPFPPLLIGVLLARKIVCSQFNPTSENVAQERCQRKSFPGITQKYCEEPKRRRPKFRLFWKYGGAGERRLIHYQLKRGRVAEAA